MKALTLSLLCLLHCTTALRSFSVWDIRDSAALHCLPNQNMSFLWGGEWGPAPWRRDCKGRVPFRISTYIPYNRDYDTAVRNLSWYKAHAPTWVVYQADGRTVANCDPVYPNIAIDITNPAVIAYQLAYLNSPANAVYNSASLDNFPGNGGAAGTYDAAGVFHVKWTTYDAYLADSVAWLEKIAAGVAPNKTVVPNFTGFMQHVLTEPLMARIAAVVGGILDEGGIARGDGTVDYAEWSRVMDWADTLGRRGASLYLISIWPEPPPITEAHVIFSVATALMAAVPDAVPLNKDNAGPELQMDFAALLGAPNGTRAIVGGDATSPIWRRDFKRGMVVVSFNAHTQIELGQEEWVTTRGVRHVGVYKMGVGSAVVLLRAEEVVYEAPDWTVTWAMEYLSHNVSVFGTVISFGVVFVALLVLVLWKYRTKPGDPNVVVHKT